MIDTTLVIMAAGMGSRYGGIKQLESVGPSGEIIMDYSIYDAIKAGFNKVVFIIRKDLEMDFKKIIGNRIKKHIKVEYVFQDLSDIPKGFSIPLDRTKPWGTGQAVLCCKNIVHEPFAVINADDYYGKEAFKLLYDFLNSRDYDERQYCMAGFILGNTLSKNGAVTRGICKVEDGILKDIEETQGLIAEGDHAVIKGNNGRKDTIIDINSVVSMNMWGFKPSFFDELQKGFDDFLSELNDDDDELKREYLLPEMVGKLIDEGKVKVYSLKTHDKWFGVTYKEDKEAVIESIRGLVDEGEYPDKLY